MFERFTEKSIKCIMLAQEESRRLGHNFVGTEQILLGLLHETGTIAGSVLRAHGVTLRDARVEVEKIIQRGSGFVAAEIPFTPRSKRVLELAWKEAKNLDHSHICTEHLLLGLIDEGEGVASRVLKNLGVSLPALREDVIAHEKLNKGPEKSIAEKKPRVLSRYRPTEDTFHCPSCMEVLCLGAILCRFCNTGLSLEWFKECPFCKEMIRKRAILCRYCKSNLQAPS